MRRWEHLFPRRGQADSDPARTAMPRTRPEGCASASLTWTDSWPDTMQSPARRGKVLDHQDARLGLTMRGRTANRSAGGRSSMALGAFAFVDKLIHDSLARIYLAAVNI